MLSETFVRIDTVSICNTANLLQLVTAVFFQESKNIHEKIGKFETFLRQNTTKLNISRSKVRHCFLIMYDTESR